MRPSPNYFVYVFSKLATSKLVCGLTVDLGGTGVVLSLCPGHGPVNGTDARLLSVIRKQRLSATD